MCSSKKRLSYVLSTIFVLTALFSQFAIATPTDISNISKELLLVQDLVDQDSTVLYKIETRDGNVFIGEIVEQNSEKIILKTENFGTVTILKTNLKSIDIINPDRIKENIYWADHMQSTRYFFGSQVVMD
jgi:hypothetical protein